MRVFIGLKVPIASTPQYMALQSYLQEAFQSHNIRAQFQHPEDFHITIQYIGEVTPQQMDKIDFLEALAKNFEKPELVINGLGSFPNLEKSRGLWMGVKMAPSLEKLSLNSKEKIKLAGLPLDAKPFVPHITVASFAEPQNIGPVLSQIYSKFSLFEFTADTLNLYQSDTGPGQPYRILKGIKLANVADKFIA